MNTDTASFNTTARQMTQMSQRKYNPAAEQLPPGTAVTPGVEWGGNTFRHFFHVFVCSAMKVNTLLKTNLKMSLRRC